jgi:hypothetical protein
VGDTPITDALWESALPWSEVRREMAKLERENAALRNKVARLENQSQWECACGGTDCKGQKENAALRSLLREAIRDHVDPYDLPESDDYIARVKTALGEGQL